MSFEFWVSYWESGTPGRVPRDAVLAPFRPWMKPHPVYEHYIEFTPDQHCYLYLDPPDEESVSHVAVKHPSGGAEFWEALFTILGLGHAIFYYGGCNHPIARDATAVDHMPPEMIESFGRPAVATTTAEFLEALDDA
jgi:hypothetical protein